MRIRRISAFYTGIRVMKKMHVLRTVARAQVMKHSTVEGAESTSEMDTHADTCCAGANMLVLEETGVICEVQGFSSELGSVKNVPVVSAATAWTDHNTGETFVLIFN